MPISMKVVRRALCAMLLGAAMGGCASLRGPAGSAPPVALEVDSHNDAAFDVFAISAGGIPQRIGMVMGFSKATFTLGRDLTTQGTVRIVAVPIGGFGAANSGPLVVRGGDTIVFTLEQVVSWSSAVVR